MNTSGISIVGILNVTPDSYFDGGKYHNVDAAVRRVGELLQEGADIIDIGGESTGPGSTDVSLEEELQRTLEVIQAVHERYPKVRLSIDTHKSQVATQAIEAGVSMINDVTAGRSDPEIFRVAAKTDTDLVLMFSKDDTPRTTIEEVQYDDVVTSIASFLTAQREAAISAGVDAQKIIFDPGMGHFISSDPTYSFTVLARLKELVDLGAPIYVSPSRKSFLAGSENLPPNDRLAGTIAASVAAVLHGSTYIRTHDVLAVRRGCEIAEAIENEKISQ